MLPLTAKNMVVIGGKEQDVRVTWSLAIITWRHQQRSWVVVRRN